jgi:hypothetical protein
MIYSLEKIPTLEYFESQKAKVKKVIGCKLEISPKPLNKILSLPNGTDFTSTSYAGTA